MKHVILLLTLLCSFTWAQDQSPVRNILTTKGDTFVSAGGAVLRQPVCPNDQVRVADSTAATGWKCAAVEPVDPKIVRKDANDNVAISTTMPDGTRNRTCFLGDSITRRGWSADNLDWGTDTAFVSWLNLQSGGKVIPIWSAGVSGNTSTQALARVATDIVPKCRGGRTFVLIGTNDATAAGYQTLLASNLNSMIDQMLLADIEPILITIPPRDGEAAIPAKNLVIRRVAERRNVTLVDAYGPCVTAATANWKAGYSTDGIHPISAGAQCIATAIWTAVGADYGKYAPLKPEANVDASNKVANSLILTDTNADGIADNLTASVGTATVTHSLVADGDLPGQWQQIERTGGTGQNYLHQDNLAVTAGGRLAFTCRVEAEASGGTLNYAVFLLNPTSGWFLKPINQWTSDITDSTFYAEADVPANTATVNLYATIYSGTGKLRFSQCGVYDISPTY